MAWIAFVGPLFLTRFATRKRAGVTFAVLWACVFLLLCRPYVPISPILVGVVPVIAGTVYGLGAIVTSVLFRGRHWSPAGVASVWFVVERIKSACGLEFGSVGYTQWDVAPARATAAWVGAAGVSWLVWFANAALVGLLWDERGDWRGVRGLRARQFAPAFGVLAFALPFSDGGGEGDSGPTTTVDVLCVPGHTTTQERRNARSDAAKRESSIARMLRSSRSDESADGPSLVVWPETACQAYPESDKLLARAFASNPLDEGTTLIAGAFGSGAPSSPGFNSVFAFEPNGAILDRYDKVRLIPFDEYQPLRFVSDILFDRETLTEFLPGKEVRPLEVEWGKVGVSICFEETFSEGCLELARGGAELLVTCANYSYFESPLAPRFMHCLARFRATETGRWLVRVCNRGPIEVIDPTGERVAGEDFSERETGAAQVLRTSVQLHSEQTVYVRFGHELVRWGCFLTLAYFALARLVGVLLKRNQLVSKPTTS